MVKRYAPLDAHLFRNEEIKVHVRNLGKIADVVKVKIIIITARLLLH